MKYLTSEQIKKMNKEDVQRFIAGCTHTQYPHFIEKIIAFENMSGREFRVFSVIMRKTIGWVDPTNPNFRKLSDTISLSQIKLATGIDKGDIQRAIIKLIKRKFIVCQKSGKGKGTKMKYAVKYKYFLKLFFELQLAGKILENPDEQDDTELIVGDATNNSKNTINVGDATNNSVGDATNIKPSNVGDATKHKRKERYLKKAACRKNSTLEKLKIIVKDFLEDFRGLKN